jgi:hypothetical protein
MPDLKENQGKNVPGNGLSVSYYSPSHLLVLSFFPLSHLLLESTITYSSISAPSRFGNGE